MSIYDHVQNTEAAHRAASENAARMTSEMLSGSEDINVTNSALTKAYIGAVERQDSCQVNAISYVALFEDDCYLTRASFAHAVTQIQRGEAIEIPWHDYLISMGTNQNNAWMLYLGWLRRYACCRKVCMYLCMYL